MSLLPEFLFLECFLTVCFERHISHYLNHIVGYANASNSEESKFQKEIICYKNISCMIHTKICYYVYFCYICSYKEFRQVSNKQRNKPITSNFSILTFQQELKNSLLVAIY